MTSSQETAWPQLSFPGSLSLLQEYFAPIEISTDSSDETVIDFAFIPSSPVPAVPLGFGQDMTLSFESGSTFSGPWEYSTPASSQHAGTTDDASPVPEMLGGVDIMTGITLPAESFSLHPEPNSMLQNVNLRIDSHQPPVPPKDKPTKKPISNDKFRCPLETCLRPHANQRGLDRHLWCHHTEYAESNGVRSINRKCSWAGCEYFGRVDNVRRHEKNRHGVGNGSGRK
ncbi:hypothetical protein QBC34DRAFT_385674 [Podospora aff. communis PSN243]|uniref:C2H2-type domain-containing protein n=1 Tax=Podospora aff. communis PSN243 TaxID=3040156 RepID=A0AAV9G7D3_9PEZI|nr:hypothetical protein QBC34DRAFT_385674 [Podospora aff. communis PSN243]